DDAKERVTNLISQLHYFRKFIYLNDPKRFEEIRGNLEQSLLVNFNYDSNANKLYIAGFDKESIAQAKSELGRKPNNINASLTQPISRGTGAAAAAGDNNNNNFKLKFKPNP